MSRAMKPFLFERDFNVDPAVIKRQRQEAEKARREAEALASAEPPPPPPPTYSQEELDQLAEESFQRGIAQGRAEAMTGIEQRQSDSLQAIGDRIDGLFRAQQATLEQLSAEVVELAYTMVRRLSPGLAKQGGLLEIETVIAEVFGNLRDEPKVVIRVHPDMVEGISPKLEEIAARNSFEGQVQLRGDAALSDGDCRLEWADGGAERLTSDLWRRIEAALERLLGHAPVLRETTAAPAEESVEEPAEIAPETAS